MVSAVKSVFISSTHADLRRYRAAVKEAVESLGLDVIAMESFGARPSTAAQTSLDLVRESDIVICIVGAQYGSIPSDQPHGRTLSYTEMEYRYARWLRKPISRYFGDETVVAETPEYLRNPGPERPPAPAFPVAESALARFKRLVADRHRVVVHRFHADPAALAEQVRKDLISQLHLPNAPDPTRFLLAFLDSEKGTAFIGRERELAELHARLKGARTGGLAPELGERDHFGHAVAITGMGGLGKTRLAIEYARRYHDAWPNGVLGLSYRSDVGLEEQLASFAVQMGIGSGGESTDMLIERLVWRIREQPHRTLVIVDDVDDPGDVLHQILGRGVVLANLGCPILFTTRAGKLTSTDVIAYPLGHLESPAALQVLLAGRPDVLRAAPHDPERRAAEAICDALGNLPLALAICGRYLREYRDDVKLTAYVRRLAREGPLRVVDEDGRQVGFPDGLGKLLRLHWLRTPTSAGGPLDDDARLVLRLAGCLAPPGPLPYHRLKLAAPPELVRQRDEPVPRLRHALEHLRRLSLLEEREPRLYQIHPLIADFVRHSDLVEPDTQARSAFLLEVAARYAEALCRVEQMHLALRQRGIYPLLADFAHAQQLAARAVAALQTSADQSAALEWCQTLTAWQHVLDREAAAIAGLGTTFALDDPEDGPMPTSPALTFAWQQVRNRALELGYDEIRVAAEQWLDQSQGMLPWLRLSQPVAGDEAGLVRTFDERISVQVSLAWQPHGGHLLAGGGRDGRLRLWHVSGVLRAEREAHRAGVTHVAWSGSGRALATAGRDRRLLVWDLVAGDGVDALGEPRVLTSGPAAMTALHWRPHRSELLAAADADGWLRLFEGTQRDPCFALRESDGVPVQALAWRPDSNLLATGDEEGAVRIWRVEPGPTLALAVHALATHPRGVTALAWARDGALLISAGADGSLALWSVPSRGPTALTLRARVSAHADAVQAVAWLAESDLVVTTGGESGLRLWRVSAPGEIPVDLVSQGSIEAGENGVVALAASDDGRMLASADRGRRVRLWEPQTFALTPSESAAPPSAAAVDGDRSDIVFAAWDGAAELLATCDEGPDVTLWNSVSAGSEASISRVPGMAGSVRMMAWSPRARVLATGGSGTYAGGNDCRVRVWALEPNDAENELPPIHTVGFHGDAVTALAWHPDGVRLASGGADRRVFVWSAAAHQPGDAEIAQFDGHRGQITALAWRPDGTLLASGSDAGEVRLWPLDATSRPVSYDALPNAAGRVTALTWHPEGRVLASAGGDGSISLWEVDAAAPRLLAQWRGASAPATPIALAWHQGGGLLASLADDRVTRLWDARTGVLLAAFPAYAQPLAVCWANDGASLLICDRIPLAGTPRVYSLALAHLLARTPSGVH